MTDEKQAYDSLDAFCAEYGFDAATTQRMREYVLATAPAQEGSSRIRKRADRGADSSEYDGWTSPSLTR